MYRVELELKQNTSGADRESQSFDIIKNGTHVHQTTSCVYNDGTIFITNVTLSSEDRFDVVLIKHSSNVDGKFETTAEVIIPVEA